MSNTEEIPFIDRYRTRTKTNKGVRYFFLGLFLSAVLCIIALGLSHIIWAGIETFIRSTDLEQCEKKVVGYFRLSHGGELRESQLSKLTHVIFSSFWYSEHEKSIKYRGGEDEKVFKAVLERSGRFDLVKMFNLESLNSHTIMNHGRLISKAITSFIGTHELDGVNIVLPDPITHTDFDHLTTMCESIRKNLNDLAESSGRSRPYVISLLVPQTKLALDFNTLLKSVDFLNLDISHYYCSWFPTEWNHLTGPASPLHSWHPNGTERNVHDTLRHYSCLTKKPNRLVMIFAFSGRYWSNVIPPKDSKDNIWMTAEKINGTVHGGWSWWRDMKRNGWKLSSAKWSDESKTSYIWDPKTRTQYHIEDERSLKEKVRYAIEKNIGGVGVWSTGEDEDEDTLLNVFVKGDLCERRDDLSVNYQCE